MRSFGAWASAVILAVSISTTVVVAAAESTFAEGVRLYQKGDFKNAAAYFIVAEKRGDQRESAVYYQALCWQQLGRADLAKDCYSRVVTMYPTTMAASQAKVALNQLGAVQPVVATTATSPQQQQKFICEVPFEDTSEGMIVPLEIGGKRLKAIWDTGACGMFFGKSQLEKAGVDTSKCIKSGRATGIGGEIQIYQLDAPIKIGTEIQMLPIMVQDDTTDVRNGAVRSQYGLIGQDFFGRYVYEVDPGAHVVRFVKRTTVSPRTPVVDHHRNQYSNLGEPFTWDGGVMVVTPKINGRECEMIWDTGATTVAFSDKQLSAAGLNRPVDSAAALSYGVGGTRNAFRFNLDSISLGPVTKTNVRANVAVFGSHPRPLLGQSFLGTLHYRVDPEKKIITIKER